MKRDVGVIIVAAGSGTRTGSAELKQFRWVAGKPMLLHSIQTSQARADVAMVVCVLPRQYVGDPPPWIFQSAADRLLLSVGRRHRREADRVATDDAALCEQIGLPVVVVRGSERAIKITEENDFALAEALSIFRE